MSIHPFAANGASTAGLCDFQDRSTRKKIVTNLSIVSLPAAQSKELISGKGSNSK
jgi:hypothetical protein